MTLQLWLLLRDLFFCIFTLVCFYLGKNELLSCIVQISVYITSDYQVYRAGLLKPNSSDKINRLDVGLILRSITPK